MTVTQKTPITPAGAPAPGGPYTPAIAVGDLVFLSGQRPVDPGTGEVVEGLEAQIHQVMNNLDTVLRAAGASLDDVVKVTVHLADISYFDAFNAVYRQYLSEPFPTRTTVGSQLRGILVEVDVIAIRNCGGHAPA
jgi:reactive intermediate/imine deaminase